MAHSSIPRAQSALFLAQLSQSHCCRYLWEWHDTEGDGEIEYTPATSVRQAGEVTLLAHS